MTSTITGLGSGFDINGWVSQLVAAKKANTVAPLQTKLSELESKNSAISTLKGKFSSLQSALQSFTNTIYDSKSDMWTNTKINSSNSDYATATSNGVVSNANVELEIQQIATSTVAQSSAGLGTVSKETIEGTKFTALANGQAKAGDFSIFLNRKEFNIEIEDNDTVSDVMKKISDSTNGRVQAGVDEFGTFSIKAYKEAVDEEGNPVLDSSGNKTYEVDTSATLNIGSSGDESNFASALKLHKNIGSYGFESTYPVSTVNTGVAMTSLESGLSGIKFFDEEGNDADSGTITINGVDFTIDKNTSINSLISKINGNSDAHVKASYDSLSNKISLTSTETGQSNISLSESGTNVLQKLNFLDEVDGEEIIKEGSQTLGKNAIVKINGNDVVSASNTITGESSGIANLSITVKKVTGGDEEGAEDKVNFTIEPDYTKVKDSLNNFVKAYNDVVETTKNYTSSDGAIGHDIALSSILANIKSLTSKVSDNEGAFSMLADIGISTSKTDATKLSIDDTKLSEALKNNFESVKSLLSDGYVSKTDNGVFDSLYNSVNAVLNVESGYFTNKTSSLESQISSMNSRIERANDRLTKYETRITTQFNKMDSVISSLTSQLSTFQAYLR